MVDNVLLPFFEALWLSIIPGGAVLTVYTALPNLFQCHHAGAASILSISRILQVVNPTLVSVHATKLVHATTVGRKNLARKFATLGLATFLVPKHVTTTMPPLHDLHNLHQFQIPGTGCAPESVSLIRALYGVYLCSLP
jgi:hypothetical protein